MRLSSSIRSLGQLANLSFLGMLLAASASAQPENPPPTKFERGQPVVVIAKEASIRRGDAVVATVRAGRMLVVRDVKDKQLHVGGPFGSHRAAAPPPGWIPSEHVLPTTEALTHLSDLIEKHPDDTAWLAARANARRQAGHIDAAIADYVTLLKKSPDDAALINGRGRALEVRGSLPSNPNGADDLASATAEYRRAIKLDPQLTAAHMNLGAILMMASQFEEAETSYTAAIQLEPKNAAAHMNRALSKASQNQLDKFLADCNRAIELDPLYYDAYRYRLAYWRHTGKTKEEIADLDTVLKIDSLNPSMFIDRGLAWFREDQHDKAVADFERAVQLAPTNHRALTLRAAMWFLAEDYDKAIESFDAAIKIYPTDGMLWNDRGVSWMNKREFDRALADFAKASELRPNIIAAHTHTAMIYASRPEDDKRDGKKAIEHGKKSLELSQFDNFYSLDSLAAAYAETGDFDMAVKTMERAFQGIPETEKRTAISNEHKTAARERLELYKAGKPYRNVEKGQTEEADAAK